MKHVPFFVVVSLLVVMSTLTGCTSAPALSAGPATIGRGSEHGREVVVTLLVHNQSEELIPLRTIEYTLWLDGAPVFTGIRAAEATLSPNDTREIQLPAVVAGDTALSGGNHAYRLSGSLTYLTPGALSETLYDLNLRVPTTSFAVEGEVTLP